MSLNAERIEFLLTQQIPELEKQRLRTILKGGSMKHVNYEILRYVFDHNTTKRKRDAKYEFRGHLFNDEENTREFQPRFFPIIDGPLVLFDAECIINVPMTTLRKFKAKIGVYSGVQLKGFDVILGKQHCLLNEQNRYVKYLDYLPSNTIIVTTKPYEVYETDRHRILLLDRPIEALADYFNRHFQFPNDFAMTHLCYNKPAMDATHITTWKDLDGCTNKLPLVVEVNHLFATFDRSDTKRLDRLKRFIGKRHIYLVCKNRNSLMMQFIYVISPSIHIAQEWFPLLPLKCITLEQARAKTQCNIVCCSENTFQSWPRTNQFVILGIQGLRFHGTTVANAICTLMDLRDTKHWFEVLQFMRQHFDNWHVIDPPLGFIHLCSMQNVKINFFSS